MQEIDNKKNYKTCIKCKDDFTYYDKDTKWDENGMSSVKLVTCPYCKCVQAIKYGKIHDVNNDERYYNYKI